MRLAWKKWNKVHQTLSFQFFTNSILIFFLLFLHVLYKISNLYKWTAKLLAQASCTELTLQETMQFTNFDKYAISVQNILHYTIHFHKKKWSAESFYNFRYGSLIVTSNVSQKISVVFLLSSRQNMNQKQTIFLETPVFLFLILRIFDVIIDDSYLM